MSSAPRAGATPTATTAIVMGHRTKRQPARQTVVAPACPGALAFQRRLSRSTAASGLRRRSYRGHVGLLLAPAASPRVISLQPIKSEETMLELYHNIISTCSQKVRLCFAEKGLTYVDRHIEFSERGHLSPEYLKLNPNGVVPTLVHH